MSNTVLYDLTWKGRRQAGLSKQSKVPQFRPPAVSSREQDITAPPESSDEEDVDEDEVHKSSLGLPDDTSGRIHTEPLIKQPRKSQDKLEIFAQPLTMARSQGISTKYGIHRTIGTPQKPKNIHRRPQVKRQGGSPAREGGGQQKASNDFKPPPKSQAKRSASPSSSSSEKKRIFVPPPGSQGVIEQENVGNIPKALFKNPKDLSSRKSDPNSSLSDDTTESNFWSEVDQAPLRDKFNPPAHIRDAIGRSQKILHIEDNENLPHALDAVINHESRPLSVGSEQSAERNDLPASYFVDSSPPTNSVPPSSFNKPSQASTVSSVSEFTANGRCPMCGASVDKAWLEDIVGGKRATTRLQAEICRTHKVISSHKEWNERGYPEIDWSGLRERLDDYHPRLDGLVDKKKPSFYHNMLEDNVRTGKYRTLKQTMAEDGALNMMVPGYYGSRGARIMVDNIMSRFSTKLRRLAPTDKLISICGVSGYVQAVLAPEIAVMLVMDDMHTDEVGAQAILRESVPLGNLLNDEDDDNPGV